MLRGIRNLQGSWLVRGLFGLFALAFVFWGVSNVFVLMGSNTDVAHVAGQPIDISAVQGPYQQALEQAEQSGQSAPDPGTRQQLADQALAQVLRQHILEDEEQKLGIRAPDASVRQAIAAIPAFQTNGQFDKAKFNQVLAQNGRTPDAFLTDMRHDIANRQLVIAAIAGAAPPKELVAQLFSFLDQQRFAEVVNIPFAAEPAPKPPADTVLQRYWRNHPARFTSPEYRTVKLVVLSPSLLAPHETIAPDALEAGLRQAQANAAPTVPERSVDVLSVGDLAASSRLQAAWEKGASWAQMQAMAKNFGASAIALQDATQSQIPTPSLAQAVFAAKPGAVIGPVAGPDGMFVFKVTDTGASGPDAAALRAQVLRQLQLQKAQADVAQDVDHLQDALAGQTPLDQLPGNIGLVALSGTLDAKGDTKTGEPAPIPGGDALKAAIVKAAFAAHPGDPAQLENGPDGSYFALTVQSVTPPAVEPYASVKSAVLADWTQDAITREANVDASDLLEAVNKGQSLDAAASAAGYAAAMTPGFTRGAPPSGLPAEMVPELFSLKTGQAAMQQTATGFTVAAVARIVEPDPAQDPKTYAALQQAMLKSLQNDAGQSLLDGLQDRDHVTVDQKLLAQLYQ